MAHGFGLSRRIYLGKQWFGSQDAVMKIVRMRIRILVTGMQGTEVMTAKKLFLILRKRGDGRDMMMKLKELTVWNM